MKVEVLQETLHQSLNLLQKAIPSKPQLPILSSVYFNATTDKCILAATDLYFGVTSKIHATVTEPGEIVIPGKQFRELIGSLPQGKIELKYEDGTLTIISGKSKTTLQCYSSEEYPPFPEVDGVVNQLSIAELSKINSLVSFCASTDVARPVLTTVLFSFTGQGLEVAATDSYRLSLLQLPSTKSEVAEPAKYLLPAKALSEVIRIAEQEDLAEVSFQVSQELKQVLFVVGSAEIYVRLIEGTFPPFEQIIPTQFVTEIDFDSQELEENLKRALIFARDTSNIIRLKIEGSLVTLIANSPSLGSFTGQVEQVNATGDDGEIAFNARYLLDYLQAIKAERVWFGMKESLKPALFKTEKEPNHQYVVMPFKVNG